MKELLNEIRERLLNQETDFFDLDNEMMSFGFATVMNCISYIREDENAVYTNEEGQQVIVEFEIVADELTQDEDTENFTVVITSIDEF